MIVDKEILESKKVPKEKNIENMRNKMKKNYQEEYKNYQDIEEIVYDTSKKNENESREKYMVILLN